MRIVRLHDHLGKRPALEVRRDRKYATFIMLGEGAGSLSVRAIKLPLDGEVDRAPMKQLCRVAEAKQWRVAPLEYDVRRAYQIFRGWLERWGGNAEARRLLKPKSADYYREE